MQRRLAVPLAIAALSFVALGAAPAAEAQSVWGREYRLDSGIDPTPPNPRVEVNRSGAAIAGWVGEGGPLYYPVRVRDASGRISSTTVNPYEDVTGAFLDARGNALVLRHNYQAEGTFAVSRRPGGAWTRERQYAPGDFGGNILAMSQSGYSGVVGSGRSTILVYVRTPAGRSTAPVTLRPAEPVIAVSGLVVNDNGSAIVGIDSAPGYSATHNCLITQVGGRNADGSTRPLVTLARRCAPHGTDIDDARLTASSSGLGAVLSWTTPHTNNAAARFGVAARTARGTWIQRVMPSLGGNTVESTVSAANGVVWVWWAVQGPRALSIYSSHFAAGRWAAPSRLRRYPGSHVSVLRLTSAAGTGQRIVAWTVQPRPGSLYISRLRTVVNGRYHEEGLGGRTTVGDVSARGHHAALIEYKQNPGPHRQDVIARYR